MHSSSHQRMKCMLLTKGYHRLLSSFSIQWEPSKINSRCYAQEFVVYRIARPACFSLLLHLLHSLGVLRGPIGAPPLVRLLLSPRPLVSLVRGRLVRLVLIPQRHIHRLLGMNRDVVVPRGKVVILSRLRPEGEAPRTPPARERPAAGSSPPTKLAVSRTRPMPVHCLARAHRRTPA